MAVGGGAAVGDGAVDGAEDGDIAVWVGVADGGMVDSDIPPMVTPVTVLSARSSTLIRLIRT